MRPWRWARRTLLILTAVVAVAIPGTVSTGTGGRHVPFKLTPRESSVQSVERELVPRLTKITAPEIRRVAEVIVDESALAGFDPFFIVAVIETESNFDVEAISSTGARGLMQVLPSTFREVSRAQRMFDPVENVRAGIAYLAKLSKQFKRQDRLLLAYNVGPGGAISGIQNDYPKKVMGKYRQILERQKVSAGS